MKRNTSTPYDIEPEAAMATQSTNEYCGLLVLDTCGQKLSTKCVNLIICGRVLGWNFMKGELIHSYCFKSFESKLKATILKKCSCYCFYIKA